jgi:Uncharacterised nucleotidyltransferase
VSTSSLLIAALRNPDTFIKLNPDDWTDVVSIARRELVLGHLAFEIKQSGLFEKLPSRLQLMLEDGLRDSLHSHRLAVSETKFAADALFETGCPVIVLKGSAYVLADLPAAHGRFAGDLDLLVPKSFLGPVEILLKKAGWHLMVKDAYDDNYYRMWMHELPPFQHGLRKTLIDMHHTILPLTGRVQPNAALLIRNALPIEGTGLYRFCDVDMVLHSAAHLIQDGDLHGGLRNLHDIHRLVTHFAKTDDFWTVLSQHANIHNLQRCLYYALAMSEELFGTYVPVGFWNGITNAKPNILFRNLMRWMMLTRLSRRKVSSDSLAYRLADNLLRVRAHYLKMPPLMLAKHLLRKQILRWRTKPATH